MIVVGEGINVVIWTSSFIQPYHGHEYWLVEGICFLRVLGPTRHWSGWFIGISVFASVYTEVFLDLSNNERQPNMPVSLFFLLTEVSTE